LTDRERRHVRPELLDPADHVFAKREGQRRAPRETRPTPVDEIEDGEASSRNPDPSLTRTGLRRLFGDGDENLGATVFGHDDAVYHR
jgi:hypothetical protein